MASWERGLSEPARRTVTDPLGRDQDPFADFRRVMLLELEQRFRYRHSLGKTSRFFLALEEGVLLGSRCCACGGVWLPPRALCPDDLTITSWQQLPGTGRLMSWTGCSRAPSYADTGGAPYLLAYVALEGASTLFLHRLRGVDEGELEHGMPVRVAFSRGPVGHPLERFWFEPA